MRVIDFTNRRTGYTFARRSSKGIKYNYYVRWHDGSVDIWPVIKNSKKRKIKWQRCEKRETA